MSVTHPAPSGKPPSTPARITPPALRIRKGRVPIVCLTAYTTPVARWLDPHVDLLLVGDSLGMVLYGFESTLPVTLEMMIAHGAAVQRGSRQACVIVDMPFGSYQESPAEAFRNAARILKETHCSGVKLEGGKEMAETIAFLGQRGIPVMAHIGLTPQSVQTLGGYRARGRDDTQRRNLLADLDAVVAADPFCIVLESVIEPLAREITERSPIPIIGIGASPACDGQILVTEDMTGFFSDFTPKFVRQYAQLGPAMAEAARSYAEDVRARRFPGPEHCFPAPQLSIAKEG